MQMVIDSEAQTRQQQKQTSTKKIIFPHWLFSLAPY